MYPKIIPEKYLLGLLSSLVAIGILVLFWMDSGLSGGSDSYGHYLIAKNAWKHPYLLLDQWGKPLYTLIALPFAQLGLIGPIILNALCLISSSMLTYQIALKLKWRYAFMGFILTLFSPVFLDNTISALTEPLCATLVILTIYFFVHKKYPLSALIAGFLPYARSEGFIVLGAIFFLLIFVKKKYRTIFQLLLGSLLMNTIGWAIEGDPFWVITQNPYINFELSGRNVCGSGGLFHYMYAGHYTFGFFVCLILPVSILYFAWNYLRNKQLRDDNILLLIAIFLLYFGAHVYIWWKGMMGSCGYVRVMTVIAPVVSLIVVYGLDRVNAGVTKVRDQGVKKVFNVLVFLFMINTIYAPYRYYAYRYPLEISEEQKLYHALLKWYETQDYSGRTKIYLYPYFSIIANIDPYDKNQHLEFWASSLQFSKKGDILIWDSHFGPNESGTSLQQLEDNKVWKKIHQIIPQQPFITMNNIPFEIHVFEKIE